MPYYKGKYKKLFSFALIFEKLSHNKQKYEIFDFRALQVTS